MHHHEAGTGAPAQVPATAASSRPPLRWPAPGLEAIHGAAWPAITLLAVGASVLAVPLLSSIATPRPFWSTGPFGASWWIPLVATLVGLAVVLRAMVRLARLLLATARAARSGYGWSLIAWTVTDASRDAGFLLQGLRHYSALGEKERRWLLNARVFAAAVYCAGLIWVPVALSFGVFLAGRGALPGTGALLKLVLVPALPLLSMGLATRLLDGMANARGHRAWLRQGSPEGALQHEAAAWRAELAERLATPAASARTALGGPVRGLGWALAALALLLPLPILTVALASAVGPAITQMTVHGSATATRLARTAVLEPYALQPDPSITPREAGEALHALVWVGRTGEPSDAVERAPVRRYAEPWLKSDQAPPSLVQLERLAAGLFARAHTLTGQELAYLERTSSHPALGELRLLARAEAADIAGARWHGHRARDMSLFQLLPVRTGRLREAATLQVAAAVVLTARGDLLAAEERLREVISAGLLLAREGPTAMDVVMGGSIAETGGHALLAFYDATGQQRRADAIRVARAGVEALDARIRAVSAPAAWEYRPRDMMASVENELLPRGMRWERLANVQLVAGCLNPHSAVFGAGAEYHAWLERVRSSLVRFPSEEALFAASMNGFALDDRSRPRRSSLVERVVAVTLGHGTDPGSCASIMGAMVALQ